MRTSPSQTAVQGALLAFALTGPALAEPSISKKLYFTTIDVPTDCAEHAVQDDGIWRCTVKLGTYADLNVQLDEMLVPMEQISHQVWTNDDVVAVLTGQFFINWMKGAVARTPDNITRWEVVADKALPRGVAACRYRPSGTS